MKGKGFCLEEEPHIEIDHYVEYWSLPHLLFHKQLGVLRIQSYLNGGFVRHYVSIDTKRMDIQVTFPGILIQEMDMRADFSFSYQRGIPSQVTQSCIHLMNWLHNRYPTNLKEPTQYGEETKEVGGSGVPQRIADYLEAYWREVLKNEVSVLRKRFTRE